jgi:hypothetical protein
MPDYLITFKAYLDPAKKPEDWPNPVTNTCGFRCENYAQLRESVNAETKRIVQFGGIAILKDTKLPLRDDATTLSLLRFVPMHMIFYIDREIKMLTADMPDENEEGVLRQ